MDNSTTPFTTTDTSTNAQRRLQRHHQPPTPSALPCHHNVSYVTTTWEESKGEMQPRRHDRDSKKLIAHRQAHAGQDCPQEVVHISRPHHDRRLRRSMTE
ncbi:hypothetical protein Hamer_G014751 [Homarus americanus]|uniref:Uncharacterized protein n=1 Tax=Homarus americanus TaxID=6706 RepID=A0A8J5N1N2_HOMAM|nr:hypothetical protein Hamer_G014751 [Homarus americanus]